jgi:hypothetical protein
MNSRHNTANINSYAQLHTRLRSRYTFKPFQSFKWFQSRRPGVRSSFLTHLEI